MSPQVDIIIPIHKTPVELLSACLDSVLAQTFQDWRALLSVGELEEAAAHVLESALSDKRFSIVSAPDAQGASERRNRCLDAIEAPYFTFLDSDDRIDPDFLSLALPIAEEGAFDQVRGGIRCIDPAGNVLEDHASVPPAGKERFVAVDGDAGREAYLIRLFGWNFLDDAADGLGSALLDYIFSALYRSETLGHVRFHEDLALHEDNLYSWEIACACSNICLIPTTAYQYVDNPDSVSHTIGARDRVGQYEHYASYLRALRDGTPSMTAWSMKALFTLVQTIRAMLEGGGFSIAQIEARFKALLGLLPIERNELARLRGLPNLNRLDKALLWALSAEDVKRSVARLGLIARADLMLRSLKRSS